MTNDEIRKKPEIRMSNADSEPIAWLFVIRHSDFFRISSLVIHHSSFFRHSEFGI